MIHAILTRVAYAIILLAAVLVLNFSLIHLAPGDVVDTISQSMGGADSEVLADIRRGVWIRSTIYHPTWPIH